MNSRTPTLQTTRSGNGLIITGLLSSLLLVYFNKQLHILLVMCHSLSVLERACASLQLPTCAPEPRTPQSCVRYRIFVFANPTSKSNHSLLSHKHAALPGTRMSMHVRTRIHPGTRINAIRIKLLRVASVEHCDAVCDSKNIHRSRRTARRAMVGGTF